MHVSEMSSALSLFFVCYQAARQLEFYNGRSGSLSKTETLAHALAIAQHHDAVTGTERQHVADDYTLRLHLGYLEVWFLRVSHFLC